jgi:putative membrane protein
MTRALLTATAAVAAVLSLAACSGEGNEQRAPDQTAEPVNKVQDVAAAATGVASGATGGLTLATYVPAAAIGDMYEIESSTMALGRSQNAQIKAAAQKIINDHKASSSELKKLVSGMQGAPAIPTELDERRKGLLDNLRGSSPNDFDDVYLDQQTAAHHEAELLHRNYAANGDNEQLKAFAAKTADVVKGHTETVTKLDRDSNADDPGGANSPGANGAGAMPKGESGQTQH